jgi:hypothetical protein
VIVSVQHGGPGPLWMRVLVAASEWGCPPWEIMGDPLTWDKLKWLWRWEYWRSQVAKAENSNG